MLGELRGQVVLEGACVELGTPPSSRHETTRHYNGCLLPPRLAPYLLTVAARQDGDVAALALLELVQPVAFPPAGSD